MEGKGRRIVDGPQVKRLYYSLSDVCRLTRLKPHTVKAWERAYGRIRPVRGKGGRLLFRPRDVNVILTIQKYRSAGYTEETIRDLLGHPADGILEEVAVPTNNADPSSGLIRQMTTGLEEIISILDGS